METWTRHAMTFGKISIFRNKLILESWFLAFDESTFWVLESHRKKLTLSAQVSQMAEVHWCRSLERPQLHDQTPSLIFPPLFYHLGQRAIFVGKPHQWGSSEGMCSRLITHWVWPDLQNVSFLRDKKVHQIATLNCTVTTLPKNISSEEVLYSWIRASSLAVGGAAFWFSSAFKPTPSLLDSCLVSLEAGTSFLKWSSGSSTLRWFKTQY